MAQPRAHGSPSPNVAAGVVVGMLAMVVIPATLTLRSMTVPGKLPES